MKRYVGYVRVSTLKQGEGTSLEAQKDAVSAFAEREGLTIIAWFEEKETAAKKGRPVFNRMLREVRAGRADGLIIHKIDRSARNFADWAKIGDLADRGIEVHFATESLDFRSRGGRLTADLQAVLAADYIRNLREEVIKGLTRRLKDGLYPYRAPVGYLDNGKGKLKTPDPVRAPLIVTLFKLYATGQHSIRSLRAEMERRGLLGRDGAPLTKTGVEKILQNPFYTGLILIRRTGAVYQGNHKPLIATALFEQVQAIRQGKGRKRVTRHNHLFRGLFRCQRCKHAMIPEAQKGHVYYRCHTHDCPTKSIREEVIDRQVAACLTGARLSAAQTQRLSAAVTAYLSANGHHQRRADLERHLAAVDGRMERLTDALVDGLLDAHAYTSRKERLARERNRYAEQIKACGSQQAIATAVLKILEQAKSLVSSYQLANPAEKRELIDLATSNRLVDRKEVYVQPASWLQTIQNTASVLDCAHTPPNSRTSTASRQEALDALISELGDLTMPDLSDTKDAVDGHHLA